MPLDQPGAALTHGMANIEPGLREVAENVTSFRVPNTGHWIAEENPSPFTAELLKFLQA